MMKGKKGVEITTGTLIIIILAVIALIAIAAFFLGGFGKVTSTIKSIFYGVTAGVSKELSIQTCQQYCDRVQSLPSGVRLSTAYCKTSFNIDEDNSGEADYTTVGGSKVYIKYYCYPGSETTENRYLNVGCIDPDTKLQLICT